LGHALILQEVEFSFDFLKEMVVAGVSMDLETSIGNPLKMA
jgi:hypothetical protein